MLPNFGPLLLSALLPSVYAHGYLANITIDGVTYQGNMPLGWGSTNPSVIRQVNTTFPVQPVSTNPFLGCGWNATKADLVAIAHPGSHVQAFYVNNFHIDWIHNLGPVMSYMASCGLMSCTEFDSANAEWFKLNELGMLTNTSNAVWYQEALYQGNPYNFTIPRDIPSGNYLLRTEIISLHAATEMYKAESYPACAQLNITGGTDELYPSPTVHFPGAYHDNDPGIYVPYLYDSNFTTYTFPGPPIATFTATLTHWCSQPATVYAIAEIGADIIKGKLVL